MRMEAAWVRPWGLGTPRSVVVERGSVYRRPPMQATRTLLVMRAQTRREGDRRPGRTSHRSTSEAAPGATRPEKSTPPPTVDVVIPAFNEERSIGRVLADLPTSVRRVIVADNNSTDGTAQVADRAGAKVVPAPRQGYGSACLTGVEYLRGHDPPDILVFLDADYSDHPEELPQVIAPIVAGRADAVIGSRVLGSRERGALLPQARAGNLFACWMIRVLYGHRYTDLGPFRAIRWDAYERLGMRDPDFGWTAELQVKALQHGLTIVEVPVSYRKRVGVSKITGTVSGTIRAGIKIITTILRYAWSGRQPRG